MGLALAYACITYIKKRGGSGKKEREENIKNKTKKREKKREKMGGKKTKKEGEGWVEGFRGAWVLKTVRTHTNNARSTYMLLSFSSPVKGQTTHTTPLTM